MEIQLDIIINAPASAAWAVLGERFGHIGEWATPIIASSLDGEPCVGAVRTCHIAGFGPFAPGAVKERLIAFEPQAMSFVYEAIGGLPRFVKRAINRWSVHARDARSCIVRTHATLELRGLMALLDSLMKWKLRADGARVLEELRHQIEHGRPHTRKLAAQARAASVASP